MQYIHITIFLLGQFIQCYFSFVNAWQKHKFIYMFTQCLSSVDGPMQTNQSEVITRLVEGTILYQWETKPTIS
jgi:hypothetical protein